MSYPDSSPSAEDLQPVRERRRHNLQRLVTEHGGVQGLGERLDMSSRVIANFLKPWDGQIAGIKGTIHDALARRFEERCELPLGWFDRDQEGPPDESTARSIDPASPVAAYDLIGRVQRELASLGLAPVRRDEAIRFNDADLILRPQLFEYQVSPPKVIVTIRVAATSSLWQGQSMVESFGAIGDTRDRARSLEEAVSVALARMTQQWLGLLLHAIGRQGAASIHVTREKHTQGDRSWIVWSVPSTQPMAPLLGPAFAAFNGPMRTLLAGSHPAGATWVRVTLAAYSGRVVHSAVLRANRPWPEAHTLLAAHAWPRVDGYESVRHFQLWLPD
jgi:hypothetical protein